MMKIYLSLVLLSLSLVLQNCNSTAPQKADAEIKNETSPTQTPPRENLPQSAKVEFKSVSFSYNPQIFGEVKTEEIAEHALQKEDDKPDSVEPQYRLFTFDLSTDYSSMYIAVYPINDFPRMYAVNKSSVKSMQKTINDFKKVLKDETFRTDYDEIPYLPFRDASQTFQVKVRHFDFPNGKGILFLTFWQSELELPSNRQLRYIFEGLTNDSKYYVLAEMPTKVSFLSDESSDEFEGYKISQEKEFNSTVVEKKIKDVNKKIANRLEKLPQNEFEPSLNELEKIISTLKVKK